VCIFLPLSAIWAGVVNETAPTSQHALIHNEFYRSAPTSTIGSTSSTIMMDKSRQFSVCTCATKCTTPIHKKSATEYEDDSIHIGRDFGFSRTDAADRV
jgi:pheromone alpha factor receptor